MAPKPTACSGRYYVVTVAVCIIAICSLLQYGYVRLFSPGAAKAGRQQFLRYVQMHKYSGAVLGAPALTLTVASNSSSCQPGGPSPEQQHLQLYVGVISASGNRAKRDAVRSTWGSDQRLSRVVFVISRPATTEALDSIRQEALETGDIILVHHVEEHYFSITHQSLEVFRSAHAFHGPVTHVMKCDDDSYIHVSRMLEFLGRQPFQFSWAGNIGTSYQPDRNPASKWYVSTEEWPEDHSAMKWSNGPGYVLTTDLARLLATGAVSKCAPGQLFKLEDVAVGSWLTCVEKEQNITIYLAKGGRFNLGSCAAGDLLSHYISPSQMRCMFAQDGDCCQASQVL